MSIEIRRHHRERLKQKRQSYWSGDLDQRMIGIALSTPAPCSCWMCGNERKYSGERTIQERRQMQEVD